MGKGAFNAKGLALEECWGRDQRIERHQGARLLSAGAEEQHKKRNCQTLFHRPMVSPAGLGRKLAPGDRLS